MSYPKPSCHKQISYTSQLLQDWVPYYQQLVFLLLFFQLHKVYRVAHQFQHGNCITVVNNGASTASAFYQKEQFASSHDINLLRIKNKEMNPYIAMFLIPLIHLEKSRFGYGRKWRYERMVKTHIKLHINKKNEPDWQFMEDYIKSLSYSSNLENESRK